MKEKHTEGQHANDCTSKCERVQNGAKVMGFDSLSTVFPLDKGDDCPDDTVGITLKMGD